MSERWSAPVRWLLAVLLAAVPLGAQEADRAGEARLTVLKSDEAAMEAASRLRPRRVIDYGDRRLLLVDAAALRALTDEDRKRVTVDEEGHRIRLRGRVLDTRKAEDPVPSALRLAPTSGPQLHLIQFPGPVKDEWLKQAQAAGQVKVVTYVPTNAYVVWTDGPTIERLRILAREGVLQWTGPFHPAYKLHPFLQSPPPSDQQVTVQFVDHPAVEASISAVRGRARRILREPWRVAGYRNLRIEVAPADLPAIAALPDVVNVEPFVQPKPMDERQGQCLANQLNAAGSQPNGPGYLAWLNARGFTTNFAFTVDVTDDGFDRGQTAAANVHADFLDGAGNSRVSYVQRVTGTTIDTTAASNDNQGGHGTLNAGIVAGLNNTPDAPGGGTDFEDAAGFQYGLGIAPFARVGSSRILGPWTNPDFTELINAAYQGGARLSSNSWGSACNAPGGCCPAGVLGAYDAASQEYDALVRDARPATALDGGAAGNQEMVIVFSSGNNGTCVNEDLGNNGSTAKNTIVVGAGENASAGTDGCGIGNASANDVRDVINFSSRGPATDGRIKPDLMAPGTHVSGPGSQDPAFDGESVCGQATNVPGNGADEGAGYFPAGQTLYTWSSGTSHSTPAVAGAAALVRQWFLNQGRPAPSPAMTKAYLANAATHMTGVGANDNLPSNVQGMGRVNLERAFDTVPRLLLDQVRTFDATGETFTLSGTIPDSTQPFRVSLAWTDAVGATVGAAWVNDLDLEVSVDSGAGPVVYRGNVFTLGQSQTGGAADTRNNLESVFLPAGTTGDFTITVRASNVPAGGDGVPNFGDATDQDFALVAYNAALPARTPADIVLVLDTSGSMGSVAPGGTDPKIRVLRDAAEMFIQAWLPYSIPTDRMGVVYFNSAVQTFPASGGLLQPFQPNAQAIVDDIRSRPASGWTALGGGLQTAINALSGGPNRKFVILFTNGMQNFSPMVAQLSPGTHDIRAAATGSTVDGTVVEGDSGVAGAPGVGIGSYGITIHTIGTGVAGAQWQDLIEDIATQSAGQHHFTTVPDISLELFFLNDLVTSLKGTTVEMVGYRSATVSSAPAQALEEFTLNASVTKATFLLSWKAPRRVDALVFDLQKLIDGAWVTVDTRSVRRVRREFATLAHVGFPAFVRKGGGLGEHGGAQQILFPAGRWRMVVRQDQQGGAASYNAGLLVDDAGLKYDFRVPRRDYGVGESIPLTVRVTDGGVPVTGLTRAEVRVARPALGLGTFLSRHSADAGGAPAVDPDHFSTPVARKEFLLVRDPALRRQLEPVSATVSLFDDGRPEHGDATAGDGVFSTLFTDTRLPGHYAFDFAVEGNGPLSGPFVRAESVATTVRIKAVDPTRSLVDVRPSGDNRLRVTLTPIDAYGNLLGPGYGHVIRVRPGGARLVDALVDTLDGSYTQTVEAGPGPGGDSVVFEVAGVAVPADLSGGGSPGRWEVQAYGGLFAFDSGAGVQEAAVKGVRVARLLAPRLAVEGELAFARTDDVSGSEGDVLQLGAQLRADLGTGPVRPFLAAGLGALLYRGFASDDESVTIGLGAGLRARIGTRVGLRAELRGLRATGVFGGGATTHIQATAGLTCRVP